MGHHQKHDQEHCHDHGYNDDTCPLKQRKSSIHWDYILIRWEDMCLTTRNWEQSVMEQAGDRIQPHD
jgi:hypothetical protein